jgi:hypothetical protein
VTYPNLFVATLINTYFVPVQVNVDKDPRLVDKFRAIWTPNINIIDSEERSSYHVEGWLPASEFSAMLLLSLGHYSIKHKRYADALPFLREVVDNYPSTTFAPEALYYTGVAKYLAEHKVEDLVGAWKQLQLRYPGASWTLSASIL